jgi:hypothetical protein
MTRDEIVDFLEWAKEEGQLQFPESRKVDMAEKYIKSHDVVNKNCTIPHVIKSACVHPWKYQEATFGGGTVCMKCKQLSK